MATQPNPAPDWKQEVNRRLAAHQSRKGISAVEPMMSAECHHEGNSRAAQAAARVAARFAKAPTFSQMQAAEARHALRAAEIATKAALEAQAAAQVAVANLEAAANESAQFESDMPRETPAPVAVEKALPPAPKPVAAKRIAPLPAESRPAESNPAEPAIQYAPKEHAASQPLSVRWEADMPVREPESWATGTAEAAVRPAEDWTQPEVRNDMPAYQAVEPDQPIHANLIEFPRELVAPRKARPRLAEGPLAEPAVQKDQLSIFEVDPAGTSKVPEPVLDEEPQAFEWSGIRLGSTPQDDTLPDDPALPEVSVHLAPFSRRLLAAVVDLTLVAGAFVAAAGAAAGRIEQLPAARPLEIGAALAFLAMAMLYQIIFFAVGEATPGMRYASISLCTFDNQIPTRGQRCGRMGSLLLSVLPLGLGLAWVVFDEDHLSWHDRLSRTYQRQC